MGLFNIFKNDKKIPFYEGNDLRTNWNFTDIVDLLDIDFMVITETVNNLQELTPEKYKINNAAHVFLDEKILEPVLSDVNKRLNNRYTYYQMSFSIFLEDILNNKYDAVVIYGMPDNNGKITQDYKIINKETVYKYKDIINVHNYLHNIKGGYFNKDEYYEKMKDINMYFIGNKVLLSLPIDSNGKFVIPQGTNLIIPDKYMNSSEIPLFIDEIQIPQTNEYAVKVYLDYDSAKRFGGTDETITMMPLSKIKEMYGGKVIIEPHRNWWVIF